MLPSTYTTEQQKLARTKQIWKSRLQLAKVFQDASKDVMLDKIKDKADEPEIQKLVDKLNKKEHLKNSEILLLGDLLKDKFTISKLPVEQLKPMCSYFNLNTYGPEWMLHKSIRTKLNKLFDEDKKVGIDEIEDLSAYELSQLNRDRGMRVVDRTIDDLKRQYKDWVELSSDKNVPAYLLLLSRSFNFDNKPLMVTNEEVHRIAEEIEHEHDEDDKDRVVDIVEELDQIEKVQPIEKKTTTVEKIDEVIDDLIDEMEIKQDVNEQLEQLVDDLSVEKINDIAEEVIEKAKVKLDKNDQKVDNQ